MDDVDFNKEIESLTSKILPFLEDISSPAIIGASLCRILASNIFMCENPHAAMNEHIFNLMRMFNLLEKKYLSCEED